MPDRTNTTGRTTTTAGVLRPEQLARHTELDRFAAGAALAPYVENHWLLRWDLPPGTRHLSQVLPHPACNLSVERGRTRPGIGADPVVVTGVVSRRFDVEVTGRAWVFATKFRPGGLAALVDGDARAWRDHTLAATSVAPGEALAPLRALGPASEPRACVDTMEEVLGALAPPTPDPRYLATLEVVADMLADRSLLTVAQVEDRHGLDPRRLQRLFARYVGVSPKWVLARYRMHDAVTELDDWLERGHDGSLADLAARHGWYDQAHFTRDFTRLVGQPPGAYVARRPPH